MLVSPPAFRRGATVVVCSLAAAAIVLGVVLLVNTTSGSGAGDAPTMPVSTAAVTPCCRLSAVVARDTVEAVVSLETAGGRRAIGCGVVVGDGGVIATTTTALRGARTVRVVAATGEELTGTTVATDRVSGVALVRLSQPLSAVASVAGNAAMAAGSHAMALALAVSSGKSGAHPHAIWTSGQVVAVDTPVPGSGSDGVAAITVRGSTVPDMPGEPLVDDSGRVVGILDTSDGAERAFLPMPLVVSVSDDLETTGHVRHGWLDVVETTAPSAPGALVVTVEAQGAASHVLRAGDVIVRLNGSPVSSAAQLRAMLYVMPPDTRVTVDAMRDGQLVKGVVRLSSSP